MPHSLDGYHYYEAPTSLRRQVWDNLSRQKGSHPTIGPLLDDLWAGKFKKVTKIILTNNI